MEHHLRPTVTADGDLAGSCRCGRHFPPGDEPLAERFIAHKEGTEKESLDRFL